MALTAGEIETASGRLAYRRRIGEGPTTLFVHGVPTDSRQWLPFLERADGDAIALDLPGFGASAHPSPEEFDYTIDGLARAVSHFGDALGVGEYSLVVHDWGVVALVAALADPDRVRRLVVMNAVPILPGYRWHRTARIWRTPRLGELQLASARRPVVALSLREAHARWRAMPPAFVDNVTETVRDPVTRTAILSLYRSADPPRLAAAGERLAEVRCPALVVWGAVDRFIPPSFGRAFAARLPNAELAELEDAGHWPWIERPDVVDRALRFLAVTRGR